MIGTRAVDLELPLRLEANTVPSFYGSRSRIRQWRDDDAVSASDPEDWIASTARRTGMGDRGLTRLPGGLLLGDAFEQAPEQWFGAREPGEAPYSAPLIKLLDAGERLPVHVHPTDEFAATHLNSVYGKAEAWVVLEAGPGASVHVGFRRDIALDELKELVSSQDHEALLAEMNRIGVQRGDVVLCPPGVPHAIGADVFVVEIQQPTDLSIMLEWEGFPIRPEDAYLGLEPETALSAVNRSQLDVEPLRTRLDHTPGMHGVLPHVGQPPFAIDEIAVAGGGRLPADYGVLFVLSGHATIRFDAGEIDVSSGEVWLVPYESGEGQVDGHVHMLRCRGL